MLLTKRGLALTAACVLSGSLTAIGAGPAQASAPRTALVHGALATNPVAVAAAKRRCRTYVNGDSYTDRLGKREFILSMRARWCWDGHRVRGLKGVRILFRPTSYGEQVLNVEYKGEDRSQRVNRVFSAGKNHRAGYDVYRVAKVDICPTRVKCEHRQLSLRFFLWNDGHADKFQGKAPPPDN